jgi:hypothetical protein
MNFLRSLVTLYIDCIYTGYVSQDHVYVYEIQCVETRGGKYSTGKRADVIS